MELGQGVRAVIDRTCGHDACEHEGRYYVHARCTNCKWEGEMRITKGHEAWRAATRAECPRCGCRSVSTGDWLRWEPADEEDDRGA